MEIETLILLLSIFAVGVGCGYYLRDRISKKRRHLESKRSRRFQRGFPYAGAVSTLLAVGLFSGCGIPARHPRCMTIQGAERYLMNG
jgi:hypothetical protein